jgi:hypothetical protein
MSKKYLAIIIGCAVVLVAVYLFFFTNAFSTSYTIVADHIIESSATTTQPLAQAAASTAPLDVSAYNAKLLAIAHNPPPKLIKAATTSTPAVYSSSTPLWPVKTVLPEGGALLPFNRIVAYYGNFYSTAMGVLGQYPPDQMMAMLASTTAQWRAADPTTPVIPALDYIAVTAQGSPGVDGKYRLRMPDSQIDKALALIAPVNGLVFLDIQVGLSNVQTEVPLLQKYLAMPNVELSLDPEFDMSDGAKPDTEIGSMSAGDIDFAANYLAGLVKQYNLPPKILVVHRFTQDMVTNSQNITPLPQVEVVMDMDGWGSPAKKINTYQRVIESEPVQFTGFKLFYKNDLLPPSTAMMTPAQVLQLTPNPSYVQYQ